MEKNVSTLSMKNRIFYGFGAIGIACLDTFIGAFLTLYATDVLGVDALHFASLLIAPKITDIVIDFFIMYFIGKTKTRFGMYRPWLLNMLAMAAALCLLFGVPFLNVSTAVMLTVVVIAYFICNSICSSFYWIAYVALPGVITQDEGELVKLSSAKMIFEYLFSALTGAAVMPVLLAFGRYEGDYRNPAGWLTVAVIFSSVAVIFSLLCFFFIRTNPELEKQSVKNYSMKDVFHDYKIILSDKYFLAVASLLIMDYLALYTNQTVDYYFYINNLGIEDKVSYILLIGAVFTIVVSAVTEKLYQKFGIRKSFIIGAVFLMLFGFCHMLSYNFLTVIVSAVFYVSGTAIITTLVFALWPVVAQKLDPEKVRTPLNSTIGVANVFESFGLVLGNTLGAAIVTFSRYNPDLVAQDTFTLAVFRYLPTSMTIVLSLLIIAVVMKVETE